MELVANGMKESVLNRQKRSREFGMSKPRIPERFTKVFHPKKPKTYTLSNIENEDFSNFDLKANISFEEEKAEDQGRKDSRYFNEEGKRILSQKVKEDREKTQNRDSKKDLNQ